MSQDDIDIQDVSPARSPDPVSTTEFDPEAVAEYRLPGLLGMESAYRTLATTSSRC